MILLAGSADLLRDILLGASALRRMFFFRQTFDNVLVTQILSTCLKNSCRERYVKENEC